jgi:type VI secretion system secreted protein VgrG
VVGLRCVAYPTVSVRHPSSMSARADAPYSADSFVPQALREALSSFAPNARLLTYSSPAHGPDFGASLVAEHAVGSEGVNQLFEFQLDLLSPSAQLDLRPLLGQEAALGLLQADGNQRHWHGIVTACERLGADGGLARYRLTLEPWLALLRLRSDCFLFQNMNALAIAEALFARIPRARFELRVSPAMQARLPVYQTRCQWNETDLDFLLRILADDGLSFHFEHAAESATSSDAGSAYRHTLVIFDRDYTWPDAAQATVRYHRSAATEAEDAMHGLRAQRRLGPATVTRASWDAAQVLAHGAQAEADAGGPLATALEDYDGTLSLPILSSSVPDAVALRAECAALAHQQTLRVWRGLSSLRGLKPGTAFTLTGHPDFAGTSVGFGAANPSARFSVQSVRHRMRNNLRLGAGPAENAADSSPLYENDCRLLPADVAVVPAPRPPAAYPGLQTARVVGSDGQVINANRDHQVRVQFHGLRPRAPDGTSAEPGTPDAAQWSAWLRVTQGIAGPDHGEVFIPRIDDEVLVDFELGDPDRPIIVAALYNGVDTPPFAAGVDGAADHPGVIAGLHSKALDGSGYNEWLLDDAPGQHGLRMASSHRSSQLNLGQLLTTRPGLAVRGTPRGVGFEWVSDGWAVARAARGVLLTTTRRAEAIGTVLETPEAQSQLGAAQTLSQCLSDVAAHQGARPLTAMPEQAKLQAALAATETPPASGSRAQPPVPGFTTPLLLLDTPSSAAFTTPTTLLSHSGRHQSFAVQGDVLHSAGKTVAMISGVASSFYSHQGGVTAIAANGPVSIQAQTARLELLADQSVAITSSSAGVTVLAQKTIVLKAGGAAITLDGENITFACDGTFSVKGASQAWAGPERASVEMPGLPAGAESIPHWIGLHYLDPETNAPMQGVEYEIQFLDGSKLNGTLDAEGKARHENVYNKPVKAVIYKPRPPLPEIIHPPLARVLG